MKVFVERMLPVLFGSVAVSFVILLIFGTGIAALLSVASWVLIGMVGTILLTLIDKEPEATRKQWFLMGAISPLILVIAIALWYMKFQNWINAKLPNLKRFLNKQV